MADPRPVELDELVNRFEGADWVLISDEAPVDEHRRDELLEAFQVDSQRGDSIDDEGEEVDELDDEQLEPDPEE
jgi:hypothetical protein